MTWQETLERAQATPPDPGRLAAAVAEAVPGGVVVGVERMHGGLGSVLHRVEVRAPGGATSTLVLRGLMVEWGGTAQRLAREVAVHEAMTQAGVAVPDVAWSHPTLLGRPSMLQSFVAGAPLVGLLGRDGMPALLAGVLADVHAVPPPPGLPVLATTDDYVDHDEGAGRTSTLVDADALLDRLAADAHLVDLDEQVTVHGDLHGGNVLWDGTRAAVVDWSRPAVGARWFDEAYARLDTWLAHGRGPAEDVRSAYLERVGVPLPAHRWWDVLAAVRALPTPVAWLPAYRLLGCTDLTAEQVEARYRALVVDALAG